MGNPNKYKNKIEEGVMTQDRGVIEFVNNNFMTFEDEGEQTKEEMVSGASIEKVKSEKIKARIFGKKVNEIIIGREPIFKPGDKLAA